MLLYGGILSKADVPGWTGGRHLRWLLGSLQKSIQRLINPSTTVELESIGIPGNRLQPLDVIQLSDQPVLRGPTTSSPESLSYITSADDGPAAVELFSVRHLSQGPD